MQCGVISNKQFLYCRISHQNRHSFVTGRKEVHCSDFDVVDTGTGSWLGCEIIFIAIIFIILTGFITTDSVSTVDISPTSIAPSTLYSRTMDIR